jgi:hypothetical protein
MTHIEEAIVERLRSGGHCSLDDVVTHLSPIYSWSEVFVAVDRMSRNGGGVDSTTRLLDLSDCTPSRGCLPGSTSSCRGRKRQPKSRMLR